MTQTFDIAIHGDWLHQGLGTDIDEDLSAQGMLTGTPAPRPGSSSDPKRPGKRVRVAKKSLATNRRRSAGG